MAEFAPLSGRMSVLRHPHVFLGFDPGDDHNLLWTQDTRDSVAVIAPPGYGKTGGIIIPSVLQFSGPVVSTSTRADVLRATGDHRARIAAERGGAIYVYDPFGTTPGISSLRWSPLADCGDPSVAYRRVQAMTAAAGHGITDGEHWRSGAASILRACFHAAGVAGLGMGAVRRWLARQDTAEPAEILRGSGSAASWWADDLEAVELIGDRERGSFYSLARNCLDATSDPRVLTTAEAIDLDIDQFLETCSTLYIISPRHHQRALRPLVVGLIDSITERAAEQAVRAASGKLADPLLLALDELPNIAPLEDLVGLVSEGGGNGIITLWAAQSLASVRARYGYAEQSAILTATTAKLVYGGMSNGDDLRDVSGWAGEWREPSATFYSGSSRPGESGSGLTGAGEFGVQHAVSSQWRPVLPVEAIQQLPEFHAWLFYRSNRPLLVEARHAGMVPVWRELFGYAPLDDDPQEAGP